MSVRRFPLALALTAAVLAGCGGDPAGTGEPTVGPTPTATGIAGLDPAQLPDCVYPEQVDLPRWFPEDLPLPPGTYAAENLSRVQGYRRTVIVIQRNIDQLQEFVFERFPKEGWVVGRGDTEPGEVDIQFSKAPAVGAFRALDQFCKPGFSLVIVIYAPDRSTIEAPVPISPNPDATPIG